jgi:hypothetical protein
LYTAGSEIAKFTKESLLRVYIKYLCQRGEQSLKCHAIFQHKNFTDATKECRQSRTKVLIIIGMTGQRGAPEGNQNARKHGFYSAKMDELELMEYENATAIQGLDEEIALLRVKIKSLVQRDPHNIKLLIQATNQLAKLIIAKSDTGKDDKETIAQAIGNVLKNISLPAGIGIIELITKLRSLPK